MLCLTIYYGFLQFGNMQDGLEDKFDENIFYHEWEGEHQNITLSYIDDDHDKGIH